MFHPDQVTSPAGVATVIPTRTGACLVAGCPCKDARILSHRRAAFFAAFARRSGETADRIIAVDPAWQLPAADLVDLPTD
ncbi:MAG TPA: hypothetical protein VFY18_09500 [Candidatus Limnocylindrales bacterium]|nr:hypothetical protein [Candidatus Limnocylindrales bacterium]